jgi:hypothetical protein
VFVTVQLIAAPFTGVIDTEPVKVCPFGSPVCWLFASVQVIDDVYFAPSAFADSVKKYGVAAVAV